MMASSWNVHHQSLTHLGWVWSFEIFLGVIKKRELLHQMAEDKEWKN